MRFAVLALLLAFPAHAQSDPFAGLFQGDQVVLELKGSAGKYAGTLTVQGQQFSTVVTTSGTSATGSFIVGGRTYKFTLTPYGNGYKLASEGVEYVLARKAEQPPPPAPAGAISDAPPASIVGSWRNARGYAQFNADGTGTVDGQSGRYEIHGDQLNMIGAQGQLTVRYSVQGDQLTLSTNAGSICSRSPQARNRRRQRPYGAGGQVVLDLAGLCQQRRCASIQPLHHAQWERVVSVFRTD
jgi:hypothetical protein